MGLFSGLFGIDASSKATKQTTTKTQTQSQGFNTGAINGELLNYGGNNNQYVDLGAVGKAFDFANQQAGYSSKLYSGYATDLKQFATASGADAQRQADLMKLMILTLGAAAVAKAYFGRKK